MKINKLLFLLLACVAIVQSCSDDDDDNQLQGTYDQGYFIVNEGNYGSGSGTLSFIDKNFTSIQNDIYSNVNAGQVLGNIAQSAAISGSNLYLIINNANQIVVSNRYSVVKTAVITTNINQPRYMTIYNGKGYVSNWGDPSSSSDDYIAVINLSTNQVEKTIPVGEGPEQIFVFNNKIYILLQGGYSQNNKVVVINPSTNSVENTITVGDVPNSYVIDGSDLYVLCGGNPYYASIETEGGLYKISASNSVTESATKIGDYSSGFDHPSDLMYYNNNFYFQLNNKVLKVAKNAGINNASTFIDKSFYKIYNLNDKFFGMYLTNYTSPGSVQIYNTTGTQLYSFTAGMYPTYVLKND